MISELVGRYRFLSNFWSCYIEFEGIQYQSVENAYQAQKCSRFEDKLQFVNIKASESKRRGRLVKIRPNFEEEKVSIMRELVYIKFRDPILRKLLLETEDQQIEEGNWWGDTFWGTVNGVGENTLGKILMSVRSEVRSQLQNRTFTPDTKDKTK